MTTTPTKQDGGVPFDEVNPKHYRNHPSGIEIISMTRWMPFNLGNAFKYIARARYKHANPITDLKKALWYITDYIENCKDRQPFRDVLWEKHMKSLEQTREKFFESDKDNVLETIYEAAFHRNDDRLIVAAIRIKRQIVELEHVLNP